MSESLPPLVAAEVDLRDFAYMPLDVLRLRDSDLSAEATDAEFRAAVMLWCAAWHQVPAASVPDNDSVLTRLAGFGRDIEAWNGVKKGALRGWVKCNDGRLYHRVIAEKANEAWAGKQRQRARTQAATNARKRDETLPDNVTSTSRQRHDASTNIVTFTKGEGEGKGKGIESSSLRSDDSTPAREKREAFIRFWSAWPNKVGRSHAEKCFGKVAGEIDAILAGIGRYTRDKPPDRPWLNPSTFLNQQRWKDEPAPSGGPVRATGPPSSPNGPQRQESLWSPD